MRRVPKADSGKYGRTILLLFLVSLVFLLLVRFFPFRKGEALQRQMLQAAEFMEEAVAAVKKCQMGKGLIPDRSSDPNQTGLIGLEHSPLTTSIGNLEAKRTTTNPNFAALVVLLLKEAGVGPGDGIVVGASSSFPALIIAVQAAAKALDLEPLMICSLGASQWGANRPDFHWLDMQNCLSDSGVFNFLPVALSLGGEGDTGEDMSPEGRAFLIEEMEASGIPFIQEPDLGRNVEARIQRFEESAGGKKIKAFINIGGSWANMGLDSSVLELKPGLSRIKQLPPREKRGVIFEMAERGIPVIHLLYIKGLVERYGLSWDPVPLPDPGRGGVYQLAREKQPGFLFFSAGYFLLAGLLLVFRNRLR
ncbi:MAG: poly-gamma-glutamate system protein [Candidatus Aminicenantes bacterium]|nr:poly-gamma-glutamate system protein [Candidatus Aminicenantes bacterium]MDH5705410.1 poly-gamma-glutamate system protein [Candidatus Aminicenantes bacterium]